MRYFIIFLTILIVIFGGAYFLLFSQTGNDIMRPYLEKYISKKIEKKVKITKYTLKTDHLSVQAQVPNEAFLVVDGDIDILKQSFDLQYHCEAENLQTPVMLIREKLEVSGKTKGVLDDFIVNGKGKAFSSNIDFDLHIIDKVPLDGNIDAKGIDIAQVLEFLGKPRYSEGKIDIVANVKNENENLSGNVHSLIHESTINSQLIQRDFNVTLPSETTYVGKIDGNINKDVLNLTSNIVSSLATLKTKNTKIDIKSQDIVSDYIVDILDLKKLEPIVQKKLYGKLHIYGDVIKKGEDITVNAKSKIFDGDLDVVYKDNTLNAVLKNGDIKHVLLLLGEKAYAYGKINVNANINNITQKNKEGNIVIEAKNGELVGSNALEKKIGMKLPPVISFNSNSDVAIKGNDITANTTLKSSLLDAKAQKTIYNIDTKNVQSDFDLHVKDLASIGKMLKQDIQGTFDVQGNIKLQNSILFFDAITESLDGNVDIHLDEKALQAKLKDVSVSKILYLLKQPNVAQGKIDALVDLVNIRSDDIDGKITYELKEGLLLGKGLEKVSKVKFPESIPVKFIGKADVKNGVAVFGNNIDSSILSMPKFDGSYDIPKGILDSSYILHAKDLTKLSFITKKVLHGQLQAKGVVKKDKDNIKFTADAPFLEGNTATIFDKGILNTRATGISIKGLSELLDFPYVFQSKGDFDLRYNTKNKKGNYNLLMKEGSMVQNQLSQLILSLTGHDLTREIYKDTILKGSIDGDNVKYTLNMKGQETYMNIPDGNLNLKTNQTRAEFDLKFQKTDLSGTIKGDISSPKVNIKSSKYLKQKATQAIEKHIPEKQKELVKDVLDLFK